MACLAYYNENDPKAAAWLKELIKRNLIAPGAVDTRSIEDVKPDDLKNFTQCHFFAGIGVWSYALRQAGWPDDRPAWTGSCPCQPFSAAGKRGGVADERHLWPAWEYLIAQRKPPVVFGEQVASKDGLGWLDTLQTDLEGSGYAFGANDLCAAGVGAPHIRQRLWFVAERLGDTLDAGLEGYTGDGDGSDQPGRIEAQQDRSVAAGSGAGRMADAQHDQQREGRGAGSESASGNEPRTEPCGRGPAERVADADDSARQPRESWPTVGKLPQSAGAVQTEHGPTGPTNGLWRDVDWLFCRDGKFRPVEPGTFPLVNGAPARVGRLRGYGNAINAEVARVFIESYMEITCK